MRFSLFTVGAFAAGAIAAPALTNEKRQVSSVLQLVQGLYNQVTALTGAINSTVNDVANVNVQLSALELANITATVKVEVSDIVLTINSVLNQTQHLTDLTNIVGVLSLANSLTKSVPVVGGVTKTIPVVESLPILKRQAGVNVSSIVTVVTSLVTEVSSTVTNASDKVPGLELKEVTEPLTKTLTTLVVDLDNIVEGVLSIVNNILKDINVNIKLDIDL